jgi:hypothetical protein
VILELLNSRDGILKSAVVTKFSIAFNILEDWQKDSKHTASPEAFKTNNIEWVERVSSKKFLLSYELSSSEALSSQ